jgi:polysaccharide biosynthesis protein PelA
MKSNAVRLLYHSQNGVAVISKILASIFSITILLLTPHAGHAQDNQPRIEAHAQNWVVYYGSTLPSSHFERYDIIVFDRDKHPALPNLKAKGKTLLGYISVGEAEKYRADYEQVRATHALLEENPNWPDHFAVDVRNPAWTKYLVETVIPQVIKAGFDGIFVDTLDSVVELEAKYPQKYSGMTIAAAQVIRTIRLNYPDLKIMINRGFEVMPHIAHDVDYVLAEAVFANYDFKTKKPSLFPESVYQEYVDKMHALRKQVPHLRFMTLDYWDMEDTKGVREIYRRHRENGFMPYVSTIALDAVHVEPK